MPFQMNMFTESFVHTLRGQLSKGMSLACTTSLTNCPRWDPRYLAILENKMVKCRTFYICQRRSGKSSTAVALIAAKMLTHPGDTPGYYCNDDALSGTFGSLVYNQANRLISNRNLQTQLVMLYRCESLRNITVNAVNKNKQVTVTFGGGGDLQATSILMCRSASKGGDNLRGHTHTTVILDELFTMKAPALIALLPHGTLESVKLFGICSPMPGAVKPVCALRNMLQYKPDSDYNIFIFTNNCHLAEHRGFLDIGCPCPCGKFYAPDHVTQNSSTDKDVTDILTGKTSFFFDERGIAAESEDEYEKAAIGEIVIDEANLRMSLDRNQSLAKWIPHFKSHSAGPLVPPHNCIFKSAYINSLYFTEMCHPRIPELNVHDCIIYVDPALGSDNWQNTSAIGIACVGLDATRKGKHVVLLAAEHRPVAANILGHVHKHIAGLVLNIIESNEKKRNVQHYHQRSRDFVKARYRIICEKNSSVNAVHQVIQCLQQAFSINSELVNRILIYHSDTSPSSGLSGITSTLMMGGMSGVKRMRLADGSSTSTSSTGSTPIGYVLGKNKKPMFFQLADELDNGYVDLSMGLTTTSTSFKQARKQYDESITTICAKFLAMMTLKDNGSISGKCPVSSGENTSLGVRYDTDDFTVALVMALHFAVNPPDAISYKSLLQFMMKKA